VTRSPFDGGGSRAFGAAKPVCQRVCPFFRCHLKNFCPEADS